MPCRSSWRLPIGVLHDRDVASALAEYPDLPSQPLGDIMSTAVITLTPDASPKEIEALAEEHGVHRLLVVDATGQLPGIV